MKKLLLTFLFFAAPVSLFAATTFNCEASYSLESKSVYVSSFSILGFKDAKDKLKENCHSEGAGAVCDSEPVAKRCVSTHCNEQTCIVINESDSSKWTCEGSYFLIGFARGSGLTRPNAYNSMVANCRESAEKKGLMPDVYCGVSPDNLVCVEN